MVATGTQGGSDQYHNGLMHRREIAKVRDYRAVSKEMKGDYLVKKGKLSKSADIILYKNRADTVLRAFVIYFKKQENIPENKGLK